MEIQCANDLFTNHPRPVLVTAEADEQEAAVGIRTLIHMDGPQHRVVCAIRRGLVPAEVHEGVEAWCR